MSVPSDPQLPGVAPAADGGRRGRLLLRVVASVVAMVLVAGMSSAVSYSAVQAMSRRSDPCGITRCLPKVDSGPLEAALTARRFTCRTETGGGWRDYEYHPARGSYEVNLLSYHPGYLDLVRVRVYTVKGVPASMMDANFMVWVTGQLFVGDAAAWARIEQWLRERLAGRKTSTAEIDSYRFEFRSDDDTNVQLEIKPVWS